MEVSVEGPQITTTKIIIGRSYNTLVWLAQGLYILSLHTERVLHIHVCCGTTQVYQEMDRACMTIPKLLLPSFCFQAFPLLLIFLFYFCTGVG